MTERAPGRYALYTHSERRPFTVTVECSSCKQETRVSYLSLVTLMYPVSLHAPFLKEHHSHLRCPACGRRTWTRIHLLR